MSNADSHQHVVKTTAQWNERAIEYWIVPRGCLCVELTPEGKTKLKVGEGNKNFYQLPYICDHEDLYNYYTKEEVDALFNNLNRMAIMSTDEYDSQSDLPRTGNKLGDVRFVKSTSPSIKTDPDLYVWDGHKWIFIGTPFNDITDYVTHDEFNPIKEKVDEIYPMAHTHANKDILDSITQADREKFDSLHNYDDTEIRKLIEETGHTHPNKPVLDQITQADLDKLDSLHNYDDTEVKNELQQHQEDIDVLNRYKHTHTNKDALDRITNEMIDDLDTFAQCCFEVKQSIEELKENEHNHWNYDLLEATTASYTLEDQKILYDLHHIGAFLGAGPLWDGTLGYVPAPEMGMQNYFLRGDGTWALVKATGDKYKAGEGIYILSGETTADTFPFKLYAKGGYVKQYIIYGAPGGVGDYNSTTKKYHIPVRVSAEGHTSIETVIQLDNPLYENDWVNFETQEYSVYRTDMTSDLEKYHVRNYAGLDANGEFVPPWGSYGAQFGLTDLYEIENDVIYEIQKETNGIYSIANVNMYDENKVRTRTILRSNTSAVQIIPAPNEKYLKIASRVYVPLYETENVFIQNTLVRLGDRVRPVPVPLQQIQLIPNTINTIDILTTHKPLDVYMETVVSPDPDPEDPMSTYTGIIYNDGVLDVTQDDPDNLNELTIHFREDVEKTLTIPTGTMVPATTTTLGGIIVGENLTIDENGVLNATGGGSEYEAGVGIDIQQGVSESYHIVEYLESKLSDRSQAIDTGYKKTQNFGMLNIQLKWRLINEPTESTNVVTSHEPGTDPVTGCIAISARKGTGMSYFAPCVMVFTSDGWNGSTSFQYDTNNHDATILRTDVCGWDDDGDISINGEIGPYHTDTGAVWKNIFLFDNAPARIYFCRIFDNDTLVRDLVPCVRDSDNIQGFYDRVGKVFYPNPSDQPTSTDYISGPETGEVVYDFTHESESDPYVITNKGIIDADYDSQNLELTLTKDDSSLTIPVADTVYTAGDNITITGEREVFTKLEYIQGKGNQNINTHKRIRSGHGKFAVDFQFVHQPESDKNRRNEFMIAAEYVGNSSPVGSPDIGIARAGSGGSYGTIAGIVNGTDGSFSWYWINSSTTTDRTNVTVEYFPNTEIGINGAVYTPENWPVINDEELYLFGTSDHKSWAKLYSVKIWDDDVLIFDGIPVKRNSDNEVGIFDKCNNEFFINDLGGGVLGFVAGPVESGADPVYGNYVGRTKTISAVSYTLPIASDTTLGGIKVGDNLTIDPVTGVLSATGGEEYVRVNTTDSYVLLHTEPSDWDDSWYNYYKLEYDELTASPPDWDPTKHYKYENDNYVLGSPGDTFVSTTWYDKHYKGLDPNTPVVFDSDVYYTSTLNLIQDGETYDTAFEKVNEAIEHIERLEQNVQFLHDNKVDVRETIDPERIEFYYS